MPNREIKTTLKLEGENEFKAAISDLNQEMAVYGSELREINSRYSENEKSMKKLSEQNKVLQNQFGVQKQKVETLKDAVSKSNEAYTQASLKYNEMVKAHGAESKEAEKAAEAVRKAEKSMNDFTIQLNNAEAGLNRAEKALKENEKEMKNLKNIKLSDIVPKEAAERVEKLAKGFKNAAVQAGKVAAAAGKIGMNTLSGAFSAAEKTLTAYAGAATAAATAIAKLTADSALWSDNLNTLSAKTHIATEDLQKMQYAAELVDVDVETVTGSIAKLVNKLDTKAGQEAFKKLGVSVTDANGALRKSEDIFYDAIEALGGIANETERDALAMDLFGKSAQDLNPLIDGGAEALKKYGEQAEELGLILSQDAVNSLNELNDSIGILKANAAASGRVLSTQFAPDIKELADLIGQSVPGITRAFGDMFAGVEGADERFQAEIDKLVSGISSKLTGIAPVFLNGFNGLLNAVIKEIPKGTSMLLPYFVDGLKSLALQLADSIPVILPVVVQSGIDLFTGLIGGLNEVLEKLRPILPSTVSDILSTLVKDGLPLAISTSFELFVGLADGIAKAAPEIIDKIPELIAQITGPEGLGGHLSELIAAGMDIVAAVASGLPKAVPELIRALPVVVKAVADGLAEADWLGIGEDIITAVGEGLLAAAPALLEIAGSIALGVLRIYWNLFDSLGKQWEDSFAAEQKKWTNELNEFGSIENEIVRRSNELMRQGIDSAEALRRAKEEVLDTDEKLLWFEDMLADKLTEQEAAGRYDTLKSTGQIGRPTASPTPKAAAKNGMPSNIPKSSQAYDDKAAEYYEKLRSEGPAAVTEAYSDMAAAEKQGQSELDKAREEAVRKNTSAAKKQQDAETAAVKKSYEEQLSAMKKAQSEEEKSEKKFYDDRIADRKKKNDKLLTDRKRAQADELDSFKKYQTEESAAIKKSYDDELARLDEKHSKKLDKIKKAYMDQLEYVDKEKYDALKAIEDEINSINGLTEAENAALKAQAEQEKIRQLQQEIFDAESPEEREKAIKALNDYRAQLERERVLEERQNRVKALEEDKKNIEEKYKADVEAIENTYKEQVSADEEKYNEAVEKAKSRFNEEYEAAKKALTRRQEDELTAYKEELAQKVADIEEERDKALDAAKERHEKELDALKEERDRRIDDLKEIHGQELEDLKSGNDKAMEYIAAQREKRLENLAEEKDQAIENAKAQSDAEIEEFKKTLLRKKELAAAAALEMAAAAVGQFGAVESGLFAVTGRGSSVPAGSTSITFNNYSPTEKTVYQQTQQNKQQLDIARQYAP